MPTLKDKRAELRHRAQTDLFFLGKNVLGYDLVERVHKPVCDFFVHKDPRRSIAEQDNVKERLLLDPRLHFKTTIDACDIIQWIICFPDIRILLMSGKEDNAKDMLHEVGAAFAYNRRLRELFPEFALPEGKEREWWTSEQFLSPARKNVRLRQPTVFISTIESAKASKHCDVAKLDDVVHEKNVGNREMIESTIQGYKYVVPLVEPFGYRDLIGTRYDYSDLYGWWMEQTGEDIIASGKTDIPFGWTYRDERVAIFCRQVWRKTGQQPPLELLFPERMTVNWLDQQAKADPYIFSCQYLNDPTPVESKTFTEDLILSHTIPYAHIPKTGAVFQTWDLGFSNHEWSDFSVCATGKYDSRGRLFIIDLDVGRYSPYELAMRVFINYMKWHPNRVGIEKAGGSALLEPALQMLAAQNHVILPLDWIPVKTGKGIKQDRIGSLHPLFEANNLFLAASIPHREELTKQFKFFPRFKHDDIPDAIALLLTYRSAVDILTPDDSVEMGGITVSTEYGFAGIGGGLVG